ncbi:MAG: hypothetical protein NXI08_01055 [bacterium]|nr:hypothetical protein [bacterium]
MNEGFKVLIDSSHFQLSFIHESHLNSTFGTPFYSTDIFWPMLDIDLYLNQPDTSSEIKKLLIFNEEGLGWEINRNELDELFLNGTSKLELNNLQMNLSVVNNDQLFTVWFINDKNERSENYQFIVKGDLPFKLSSENYWISNDTLEFENSVYQNSYNNYIRGYNPITDSDNITIQWLDDSFAPISILTVNPEEFRTSEYENIHHLQTQPSASEIAYNYTTFTQHRTNSTYKLLSAITPVLKKPGDNVSIYKVAEHNFRLLHHDDTFTTIISQHPTQPNELSYLEVFSSANENERIHQIDINGSIYNDLLNVYFDADLNTIYYFDTNSELYYLDLTTGEQDQVNEPNHFGNSYTEKILPYGDHLLIGKGNISYLLNRESKETSIINNFSISGVDANSFYFSSIDTSLYIAVNNRRFYKIRVTQSENVATASIENFYNPYNSSTSYGRLLNLHFDTNDSLLIHSSGLALSIKKESAFTVNSITTLPSLQSNSSIWFDNERTLVAYVDNGLVNRYLYDGSTFTKEGTLNYYLNPFSIQPHHSDSDKLILLSHYYQGFNRPRAAMLQSYTLDDFQTNTSNMKINFEYKAMSRVRY